MGKAGSQPMSGTGAVTAVSALRLQLSPPASICRETHSHQESGSGLNRPSKMSGVFLAWGVGASSGRSEKQGCSWEMKCKATKKLLIRRGAGESRQAGTEEGVTRGGSGPRTFPSPLLGGSEGLLESFTLAGVHRE